MIVCKKCGSEKLSAAALKYRSYTCTKCRNASPAGLKARRKWMTGKGQGRHIRVGGRYCGYGKTREHTQAIAKRGRELVREFKQGQSERAKMEGVSAGRISPEATPRDDRLAGRRADAGDRSVEVRQVGRPTTGRRGVRHSGR